MALEYKNHRAFPLRLSPFMSQQAELLAQRAGVSLHSFILLAVLEKLHKAGLAPALDEGPLAQTSTASS